jgi:hypothetical protein
MKFDFSALTRQSLGGESMYEDSPQAKEIISELNENISRQQEKFQELTRKLEWQKEQRMSLSRSSIGSVTSEKSESKQDPPENPTSEEPRY